jgi:predicted ester cyclase
MSAANKALVRRVFDALNRRDVEEAAKAFASGYVWRGPGNEQATGPDGWKQLVSVYLTAFPDLRFRIDDLIAEDDKVVTRFVASGTFSGPLGAVQPTGRRVDVPCVLITRIEGGQIVEDLEVWDQLSMFQELGALAAIVAQA